MLWRGKGMAFFFAISSHQLRKSNSQFAANQADSARLLRIRLPQLTDKVLNICLSVGDCIAFREMLISLKLGGFIRILLVGSRSRAFHLSSPVGEHHSSCPENEFPQLRLELRDSANGGIGVAHAPTSASEYLKPMRRSSWQRMRRFTLLKKGRSCFRRRLFSIIIA